MYPENWVEQHVNMIEELRSKIPDFFTFLEGFDFEEEDELKMYSCFLDLAQLVEKVEKNELLFQLASMFLSESQEDIVFAEFAKRYKDWEKR